LTLGYSRRRDNMGIVRSLTLGYSRRRDNMGIVRSLTLGYSCRRVTVGAEILERAEILEWRTFAAKITNLKKKILIFI
jgi:hypothetical protein